jgi:hypothetical protein
VAILIKEITLETIQIYNFVIDQIKHMGMAVDEEIKGVITAASSCSLPGGGDCIMIFSRYYNNTDKKRKK